MNLNSIVLKMSENMHIFRFKTLSHDPTFHKNHTVLHIVLDIEIVIEIVIDIAIDIVIVPSPRNAFSPAAGDEGIGSLHTGRCVFPGIPTQ
jgi:hypothetical protein